MPKSMERIYVVASAGASLMAGVGLLFGYSDYINETLDDYGMPGYPPISTSGLCFAMIWVLLLFWPKGYRHWAYLWTATTALLCTTVGVIVDFNGHPLSALGFYIVAAVHLWINTVMVLRAGPPITEVGS